MSAEDSEGLLDGVRRAIKTVAEVGAMRSASSAELLAMSTPGVEHLIEEVRADVSRAAARLAWTGRWFDSGRDTEEFRGQLFVVLDRDQLHRDVAAEITRAYEAGYRQGMKDGRGTWQI